MSRIVSSDAVVHLYDQGGLHGSRVFDLWFCATLVSATKWLKMNGFETEDGYNWHHNGPFRLELDNGTTGEASIARAQVFAARRLSKAKSPKTE